MMAFLNKVLPVFAAVVICLIPMALMMPDLVLVVPLPYGWIRWSRTVVGLLAVMSFMCLYFVFTYMYWAMLKRIWDLGISHIFMSYYKLSSNRWESTIKGIMCLIVFALVIWLAVQEHLGFYIWPGREALLLIAIGYCYVISEIAK